MNDDGGIGGVADEVVVFHAREFVTLDPEQPAVDTVAVRGDRIIAVGDRAHVLEQLEGVDHSVHDAFSDRVVLPGLIDQHLHPILGASTLTTAVIATEDWVLPDVTYPAAHSHDEYVSLLTAAEATLADPAEWLFSWGYHSLWHGEINRDILDSVSSTRPIGIWQRSCHEMYFNSSALEVLGVSQETLPDDAEVCAQIDLSRGHFWERGLMAYAFGAVMPHLFSPERFVRGLDQMVRYLHQNGVTAFNEPGAILVPGAWELYEQILGADDTPFYSFFLTDGRGPAEAGIGHAEALEMAEADLARAPTGKLRFFPKQVKLFADGAIISQLMQLNDPYLDAAGNPNPDHHGEWLMSPELLDERSKLYWDEGFQIHIHVNGDKGLDVVLNTIEKRMAEHPRIDHRTVIVHFANSTESQIDRIAKLGAIVSANPYYPVGFADKYGEVGLGPERADVMVRSKSVVDRGIPLSFHSDLPMGPSDPLAMMHFAVNRQTASGRTAGPEQRITAEQALRAVTLGAAQSWRMEDELGSIEVGKIANFTVVDANPLSVDPSDINSIDVLGSVFEGRWFPAAPGTSRVSPAHASAPSAHGLHEHDDDHDGHGCICGVARELLLTLERNGFAA